MTSWNIVVCSNIQPKPIVIDVPDPAKWTARDLRSEAGKKLGYPEEDLTLYCNETVLPKGKPLTECQGLKNGVALLATIKPSTVHVFCPHIDATLQIDIPRREWGSWTGATLRTVVCFKLGIDPASSKSDVLALKGESLCDSRRVCETGGKESLLTYTRIQQFQLPLPIAAIRGQTNKHVFAAPSNVTKKFACSDTVYNRDVSTIVHTQPTCYPEWLTFWTITVQQLDGTKTSIKLPDINRTPIYKLRELVKEALSIPTHQQKLTLGGGSNNTIVLEDWDEKGGAMAISHYPSLHDGATLYLVQLTEGIHVKVAGIKKQQQYCRDLPNSLLLPNYINIHSPGKLSLRNMLSIMTTLCKIYSSRVYCQSTGSGVDCYSDAPVASVKWIVDGCTLTMTKPQLKAPNNETVLSSSIASD